MFTFDNYGWPNDKRVGVGIGYLHQLNQFYSVYFLVANGGLELSEATSDTVALKAAYE